MQINFTEPMESLVYLTRHDSEVVTEYPATERQEVEWNVFTSTPDRTNNLSVTGVMEHVDVHAFENAFQALVQRHESLRTTYKYGRAGLMQVIHTMAGSKLVMDYIDLSGAAEPERKLQQLKEQVLNISFDLINGPVYQVSLVKLSGQKYIYGFVIDHIAADSLSIEILKTEFQSLYVGYASGGPAPRLEPLLFQMKDYGLWEYETNNSYIGRDNLAYWLQQLQAPLPVFAVGVPVGRNNLPLPFKAGKCTVFIDDNMVGLSRGRFANTTIFITAVLDLWLSWLTQNNSVMFGMPVSVRESDKLNRVVGYLIAALYLKIDHTEDSTFYDLHKLIIEKYSEALAHRHYPRKGLPAGIDTHCTAMLKVNLEMFKHQNYTGKQFAHEYLSNIPYYPVDGEITAFKNGFALSLHYNTALFLNKDVTGIFKKLPGLFSTVINHPERSLQSFKDELSNMPE